MNRPTTEERFWAKVNKDGPVVRPELGPCWLWMAGCRGKSGYGGFTSENDSSAHRYSWALANGRRPSPSEVVRHKCDVRRCVNPSHLIIGTQADNVHDALERGRMASALSSLVPVIPEIRRMHEAGMSGVAIARSLSVGRTIVRKYLVQEYGPQMRKISQRGSRNGSATLTEDDVREIRRLRASGVPPHEVSKRFGVGAPHIRKIVIGQLWRHVDASPAQVTT